MRMMRNQTIIQIYGKDTWILVLQPKSVKNMGHVYGTKSIITNHVRVKTQLFHFAAKVKFILIKSHHLQNRLQFWCLEVENLNTSRRTFECITVYPLLFLHVVRSIAESTKEEPILFPTTRSKFLLGQQFGPASWIES